MPAVTLVASSLGFVFGTLAALIGNNESVYYCVIHFLREPSRLPEHLKCRRRSNPKQQIELMAMNSAGSSRSLSATTPQIFPPRRSYSLYDLEPLPSLCTSDTESEPDTATAASPSVQEPRFLSFWDHAGLQDAAP